MELEIYFCVSQAISCGDYLQNNLNCIGWNVKLYWLAVNDVHIEQRRICVQMLGCVGLRQTVTRDLRTLLLSAQSENSGGFVWNGSAGTIN